LDLKARNMLYFFEGFCKPHECSGDDYSMITNNPKQCNIIAEYGLSNVPRGRMFNLPYPETQEMTGKNWQEMYPNQDTEPALSFKKEKKAKQSKK